jgi:wyosine [tRNA(Phe)-imidazoG37] synthetase (radical SAM superfamily)
MAQHPTVKAVYGPVQSWRFGQSLGIDPIGARSTCSFNCVYCQLGEIEERTTRRQVFVSTEQILQEIRELLPQIAPDVVTLSGSGEPTLALNLGEILQGIQSLTGWPTVVLTNGSLLQDETVRSALQQADQVMVKLDAIAPEQLQRVNRPVPDCDFDAIVQGIRAFAQDYRGHWAVQTMLLQSWPAEARSRYIRLLNELQPQEVQINVPSRPRARSRRLEARGNELPRATPQTLQQLRCLDADVVRCFAQLIEQQTGIPTRYRRDRA